MHTMDVLNNKPFRKYSFFLDLRNSPQIRAQLIKHIDTLGGRIDEFFNQKVKYIVTDRARKEWPIKDIANNCQSKTDGDDDQRMATSSAAQSSATNLVANNSNANTNKLDLFSRGKLLLSKTGSSIMSNLLANVSMKKPTTDVLELARIWNIKIIQAYDMLEFCRKHLNPRSPNQLSDTDIKVFQLRPQFIKVEDNRGKYRPVYKEMFEWPKLNFEANSDVSPFVKRRIQNVKPSEDQSNAAMISQKMANKAIDDHIKHNDILVNKKLTNKRKVTLYCEICHLEYEDINLHLKSETHDKFTQNRENYRELESVISSLPRFWELTTRVERCHEYDDRIDECDSYEESPQCSPFQSTPNMSTTIQLSGPKVKHKSQFLAIHDLIVQNIEKDMHENHCELNKAETSQENEENNLIMVSSSANNNTMKSLVVNGFDDHKSTSDYDMPDQSIRDKD